MKNSKYLPYLGLAVVFLMLAIFSTDIGIKKTDQLALVTPVTGEETVTVIRQDCSGYATNSCFTSLSAWESNYGGIDFAGAGCTAGDLTCLNTSAVARIEGSWTSPDTTAVTIDGWTTSATNYIKIYTDSTARHDGKWNTSKYRLQPSSGAALRIEEDFVTIEGLQIQAATSAWSYCIGGTGSNNGVWHIGYNILRGGEAGIDVGGGGVSPDTYWYNDIIYDYTDQNSLNYSNHHVYNTVFKGADSSTSGGLRNYQGTLTVVNSVSFNNTDDFSTNSGITNISYTASDDGDGTNAITPSNWSNVFNDYTNGNFHLKSTDTDLKDSGTSNPSSGLYSDDIDGDTRSGTWDIGADEQSGGTTPPPTTYQCNDGSDNDSDGLIDYPSDPGCTSSTDNSEYNAPTTDTTAPTTPTNLSATAVSTSQINLTWTASTDNTAVSGYRIYRNGSQITTTTNTSYSNTGLTANTSYSYTVSAYDSAGNNSSQSSSVSATTQSSPPPSSSSNLLWSTTYNCSGWNQGSGNPNCDNLKAAGGWTDSCGNGEQITAAANYPGGAGGKGQRHWIGDGINSNSGGLDFFTPSGLSEFWFRFYFRYQAGFQWSALNYQKLIYVNPAQAGASAPVIALSWGDAIGIEPQLSQPAYGSTRIDGPPGWATLYGSASDGSWHQIEGHMKMDTNGQNGIAEVWVDNVKTVSANNVNYGTAGNSWSRFRIGSNQRTPNNGKCMYLDFDDVAISTTGRIGPVSGTTPPSTTYQCNDGSDNDSDGLIDYPSDPGCTSSTDNSEYNAPTTDTTAPTTPTNLSATAVSTSQINLTWTASTDNTAVSGYRIYRNGSQITTTTNTSYSNTGLTANTSYSYTVSAYDSAGNNSSQSSSVSATTQTGVVLPPNPTTTLFQEGFEDSSFTRRSWYDSTNLKLSTTEKHSGNSSVEYHFLTNATTPEISGTAIRKLFTASDEVYVRYYVKYSSNWTGSNKAYHPHQFYFLTNEDSAWSGLASTHLTTYIEENEGTPMLSFQDSKNIDLTRLNQDLVNITETRSIAGCNGISAQENPDDVECYSVGGGSYRNGKNFRANQIYFSDTPGSYYKNDWHKVEAYFKLNSISNGKGQSDGIAKYWYDDQLVIDQNNIVIRTAQHPNMKFNQFIIAPWIGDGSPIDQTFWVDDLLVGTSRPGVITPPVVTYQCSDNTDNDSDGLVDYPSDPGCISTTDDNEYNAPIVTDTTAPTNPNITINQGNLTNSTTVTLSLSATDDTAVTQMQFSNNGTTFTNWETYNTSRTYTLTSTNGIKTVYVRYRDAAGNISNVASDSITLDNTPPTIFNVTTSLTSSTTAIVRWNTNKQSTTQLEYGFNTNYGKETNLDSNLTTSHAVNLINLSPDNTTYHFRVKSTDNANNQAISTDRTFITPGLTDSTPPSIITDFTTSNVTQTSVTLTWTAPGDDGDTGTAASYDIRYSTNQLTSANWPDATQLNGEPTPAVSGTQEDYYVAVGLKPSTTYYFAIKALDDTNNTSNISNIISFTTLAETVDPTPDSTPIGGGGGGGGNAGGFNVDITPPNSPTNFTATSADSEITLTWINPTDRDFARVLLLRSNNIINTIDKSLDELARDYTVVYEGRKEQYTDTNLVNGQTYYYSVLAYDKKPNLSTSASLSISPLTGVESFAMIHATTDQQSTLTNTEPISSPLFVENLWFGLKNDSVKQLQQLFAQDPAIYPEGIVTGYFGTLTQKAVKRFQTKYDIVSYGSPTTTGYGTVGPKTRKMLNEVYGGVIIVDSQQPATTESSSTTTRLTEFVQLTLEQINAILNLLTSFGTDNTVVNTVEKILRGW